MGGDTSEKEIDKKGKKGRKTEPAITAASKQSSGSPSPITRAAQSLGGVGARLLSPRAKHPPSPLDAVLSELSKEDQSSTDSIAVDGPNATSSLSCDHRPLDDCPCGRSTGKWKIDCSKCSQFWHIDCVSLQGLGEKQYNKLMDWLCPLCYVAPIATAKDTSDCNICRNTRVLQKANNQYEQLLCNNFQTKIDTIMESTKEAFAKNNELIEGLQAKLESLKNYNIPPPASPSLIPPQP